MSVPSHRIEIRKSWSGFNWSNDYLVEASSMTNAESMAVAALALERGLHANMVLFEYYRISTTVVGDRTFRHVAVNLNGSYAIATTNFLPMWNCLRADFHTTDSDPARKYWRTPIAEADQDNGVVSGALITAANTAMASFISAWPASTYVVTNKGQRVVSASLYGRVAMRQLHRHKKKKVVIPA